MRQKEGCPFLYLAFQKLQALLGQIVPWMTPETEVEKLSLPDFMRLRDYVRDSLDFSSEPDSEI